MTRWITENDLSQLSYEALVGIQILRLRLKIKHFFKFYLRVIWTYLFCLILGKKQIVKSFVVTIIDDYITDVKMYRCKILTKKEYNIKNEKEVVKQQLIDQGLARAIPETLIKLYGDTNESH